MRDGNLFLRHVHPDDRFLLLTDLESALKGMEGYRATYRWIRPDNNEVRWLHCRATLNREAHLFEGMMIDLSDEFTGTVGAVAGPDSVSHVLSAFPALVFTLDADKRLVRTNRSRHLESFNFGDQKFNTRRFRIGRPWLDAFGNKEIRTAYDKVTSEILEGDRTHYRTRVLMPELDLVYSVEILPISKASVISGLLLVVADVSESVRMEREVAQLQKVEGMGLLAAGVAHNFNNALQGILGQAALLASHSKDSKLVKKVGQSIIEIVQRSSDLTSQLLAFDDARQQPEAVVDLNLIAMSALNKIEGLFSKGLKVAVAFGSTSLVKVEQAPMIIAISSILRNALEVLGEGGQLTLRTELVQIGDREVEDLAAGSYARLSVSDSGPGMPPEAQRRCFEPFFTTKESDPATGVGIKDPGLGLSSAYATVRKFGGRIVVDSSPGVGTRISVYLPAQTNENSVKDDHTVVLPKNDAPEILVVDDDTLVLRTLRTLLSDMGYSCVVAEDSAVALTQLKNYRRSLRLILLDAVMPGIDGATFLRRLRGTNNPIKVIGFSGAPPEHTTALLEAGALQVLRKPVGPKELRRAIEHALVANAA